jgi:hypothetical protein
MARAVFLDKGDGYGFHLASEKGVQFIRRIVEDSPAQNAGMLEGDRLLGVCKFQLLSHLVFFRDFFFLFPICIFENYEIR